MLGSLWAGYLGGAVLGGLAERAWAFESLAVPMAVVGGLALWLVHNAYEPNLPGHGGLG